MQDPVALQKMFQQWATMMGYVPAEMPTTNPVSSPDTVPVTDLDKAPDTATPDVSPVTEEPVILDFD